MDRRRRLMGAHLGRHLAGRRPRRVAGPWFWIIAPRPAHMIIGGVPPRSAPTKHARPIQDMRARPVRRLGAPRLAAVADRHERGAGVVIGSTVIGSTVIGSTVVT